MKHSVGLLMFKLLIAVAVILSSSESGISKGALVGIILGAIAVAVTLSVIVSLLILRKRTKDYHVISKRRHCEYLNISGKCIISLFFTNFATKSAGIICISLLLKLDLHTCAASKSSIKIDGVKSFIYGEMALATNNFSSSSQVGQGGYGKVYKGILTDGKIVAIKRAQEGSLQGEKEFLTEIQLLSRLHHRNLVSLIGYCDEEGEQVLMLS